MTSWQPIESAPKDGTRIEGYSTFTGQLGVTRFITNNELRDSKGWLWRAQEDGVFWGDAPTHWRELPQEPTK